MFAFLGDLVQLLAVAILEGPTGFTSAMTASGRLLAKLAACAFRELAIVRFRFAACCAFLMFRFAVCVCRVEAMTDVYPAGPTPNLRDAVSERVGARRRS